MHQLIAVDLGRQLRSCVLQLARPPDSTERLPLLVRRMLAVLDGKHTLAEVCALAQLPVAQGEAVVRKLTRLGIVALAPSAEAGQQGATSPAEFSAEEEAFFSAEVKPIDECDEPFESVGERVNRLIADLVLKLSGGRRERASV